MRILIITYIDILDNTQNGGLQCAFRNKQVLESIFDSADIYVCCFSKQTTSDAHIKTFPYPKDKKNIFINSLLGRVGYTKENEKDILDYIKMNKIDMVFFDGSLLGGIANKIDKNIQKITFMHNIEKSFALNRVKHKGWKFFLILPQYFAIGHNERELVECSTKIFCLNQRDSNMMQQEYNRKADMIWPITFKDIFEPDRVSSSNSEVEQFELLFVGSMFQPNVDGIRWFVSNIMIHLPCKLIVVGKGMESLKGELNSNNVEVVGTVDDLSEYYYRADAMVLPILWGDGMKVKTAEALMFGKTIFATDEALEGYMIENTENIYRCNSADEFINKINTYIVEKNRQKKYNPSIRELFLSKYETNGYIEKVKQIILGS